MTRSYAVLTILVVLWGESASARVAATVNGEEITSEEVNNVLIEGMQGRLDSLSPDKQNELRHRIIEGMIVQKLIYEDAQKTGVLDSKEYKQELEALISRLKMQLAAKVWEQNQFEAIKVDAKEVKAYFDRNPNEFIDKEKIHVRHILLKSKEQAQAIISRMKPLNGSKLKKEFMAEAQSHSIGASASKGGDLGYFYRGQMVPSLNEAAFRMKKETISSTPIRSQFGYHVIYIDDRKSAKKMGFDEVKSFIEQRLKMDKFKAHMEKKMAVLREKAKITYTK